MKCPVCGNEDENYISYINKRPYCRKCIAFGRTYLDEVYPIHKTPLIMTVRPIIFLLDYHPASSSSLINLSRIMRMPRIPIVPCRMLALVKQKFLMQSSSM